MCLEILGHRSARTGSVCFGEHHQCLDCHREPSGTGGISNTHMFCLRSNCNRNECSFARGSFRTEATTCSSTEWRDICANPSPIPLYLGHPAILHRQKECTLCGNGWSEVGHQILHVRLFAKNKTV